jgi:hypothetical protein
MEYHGTRLPTSARRSEPSWPAVIATTVRLWFERHRIAGRKGTRGRRVAVVVAAVGAVALGAGVVGAVVGHGSTPAPAGSPPNTGSAGALEASATTRAQTANWIAAQVAASAVVACDPSMCATLQADGLPAARLLVLGAAAADPLGSDVVVATSAVRNEFGSRLESVYAPVVIASFGSGTGRIDVRATAPDGTAAYESGLAADLRSRVSAGAQLLRNSRIAVAPGARAALSTGDVDPRLLVLLAALAVQQPVRIDAFGDPSPNANAAVPLRDAQIAPLSPSAQAESRLRSMLSFIDAQQQPFLPLRASLAGTSALTVEYAAPSPLGLISGS